MKLYRGMSIRLKLTLAMTATSAVLLASAGAVLLNVQRRNIEAEETQELQGLARIIGANSVAALAFDDVETARGSLSALSAQTPVVSAALYTAEGRFFASYRRKGATQEAPPAEAGPDGVRLDHQQIVVVQSFAHEDGKAGTVYLRSDLGEVAAHLEAYRLSLAVVLVVSGLAAFVLAAFLGRVFSRPILRLTEAARAVSRTRDYSLRVPRASEDELGVLTADINGMLGQIEASDAELRQARDELAQRVEELGREARDRVLAEEALHKSEEQLRQAQKLEAIGRLAGGVAHDFNNHLNVIVGYGELLLGRADLDAKLRHYTEEMVKAGYRSANLTRQLLAFSRKQILQPRVVDVNAAVADLEKMLRRLIGEDINLVTELAADLGKVRVDPGQLEQVVMNLAVNARDAMPRGGALRITTCRAHALSGEVSNGRPVAAGEYVQLTVVDEGFGMDAVTLAQVFEPFFTTKEQGKGTGLGLATVYGIVQQSGGHIWVESEPGRGTSFRIWLPRDDSQETPKEAERSAPPAGGRETILLVEDDDAARAMMGAALEELGYRVLPASQGREGLAVAAAHHGPIDLVLTDVVMPQMGGRELVERLTVERPDTRVLYMSGYIDDAVVRHGVVSARTAFLQKPFAPSELARKLREVLEGGGVARPSMAAARAA